ncbi:MULTISPECIES: NAD-dependent epimerase/dehydratase family protein [Pseudofrankia]|uniref:NAD-dependent epimerase/dehydratase family protein n=1 Tax=Pseudofrankia TaxID=2994363 RepID=UPI000234BD28|nr:MULTISPECIES: NAD(P)-dependent oxidoreductase [Pseudofrankia]OHV32047.1 epimerase [Pseudofrankia sp. EUN1h]
MRVLVTGVRGKVGGASAAALVAAGHDVVGTDRGAPVYDSALPGELPYIQADLTDAGDAFAVVRGFDVVVHAAAIPEPRQNPAHTVFANNVTSAFHMVEACAHGGAARLVNISSDSVPGFTFAPVPRIPDYCPIDEEHPNLPLDPYAQAKYFAEQLCDALVARSAVTAVSIRPAWVQSAGNYERNLGPFVRDPDLPSPVFWSYVDLDDLAELVVLAAEADSAGHRVVLAAQPDNIGGRDLRAAVARHYPTVQVRELERPDASGYSIARARELFDWDPRRSWRDHLDAQGQAR